MPTVPGRLGRLRLVGPEPVDPCSGQRLTEWRGHPFGEFHLGRRASRNVLDMAQTPLATVDETLQETARVWAREGHVIYGRPVSISVTTSEAGEVHIVHVAGEIDVTSAAVLRDALEALIADGRRRLTLDLTDVTFLDSTGLGIVVGRLKRLARHGGTLTVAASHERVRRVFDITGLDLLIAISPDLEGAVEAARAPIT